MSKKLRFAIMGCGAIAKTHVQAIQALAEDAELVAACDEVPGRARALAEQVEGVHAFTDLPAMLREADFEVLDVCVPSGLHARYGVPGARAGKHVVVEKPLDVALEAADALIAACRENDTRLAVVSQHRYSPGMRQLHRWLRDGRLGRLCYGEATIKWHRTQDYYDAGAWRGTWELDGGGALMNQGIHYADQLRWLMGPVKSVAATMATRAHERIEVEDVVSATIAFENGAVGTLTASTACWPGFGAMLEIYGTQGAVRIEAGRIRQAHFRETDETFGASDVPPQLSEPAHDATATQGASDPMAISLDGHIAQLRDLIAAVREGREPRVNGPEARATLELVLGIYRSARTGGGRVTFPLT